MTVKSDTQKAALASTPALCERVLEVALSCESFIQCKHIKSEELSSACSRLRASVRLWQALSPVQLQLLWNDASARLAIVDADLQLGRLAQKAEQLGKKWAWAFWQRDKRIRQWLNICRDVTLVENKARLHCGRVLQDEEEGEETSAQPTASLRVHELSTPENHQGRSSRLASDASELEQHSLGGQSTAHSRTDASTHTGMKAVHGLTPARLASSSDKVSNADDAGSTGRIRTHPAQIGSPTASASSGVHVGPADVLREYMAPHDMHDDLLPFCLHSCHSIPHDGDGTPRSLDAEAAWTRLGLNEMPEVTCQCHLELDSHDVSNMEAGLTELNQRLASAWRWDHGPERDPHAALRDYKEAEALGSAYAANRIGMVLLEGVAGCLDASVAAHWFRHAATRGSAEGLHNLGSCYEMGLGMARDTRLAEVLYAEAAAVGCSDGLLKLACLHLQAGERTVAVDRLEAAAVSGNVEADCFLSSIVCVPPENGLGAHAITGDLKLWMKAVRGNPDAQQRVGEYLYEQGHVLLAEKYLLRASRHEVDACEF